MIAVVQIKKRLYKKDIREGFENLHSILELAPQQTVNVYATARRSFQQIAQTPLPENVDTLPPELRHLYWMLRGDACLPCRILLGYHGYKTETTFRQGLLSHIEGLDSVRGWPPVSFPGFVIGPNTAAIKNTAMPWGTPLSNGWWPLIVTTDGPSPSFVFLEAIWTRLNHLGLVDASIFGDDLSVESWTPLVDARLKAEDNWEVRLHDADVSGLPAAAPAEWAPAIVGKPAFVIANMLCNSDPKAIDVTNLGPEEEIAAGVSELEAAGIAARDANNPAEVYLLTSGCACVILPGGRFAVGENNSGRMERWVSKFTKEHLQSR